MNGNKGPIFKHNELNKFICKLIERHKKNYEYEPAKIDDETLERPDIVVHDRFSMLNGDICPFYIDTMITCVRNERNVNDLDLDNFGIFNAEKYAEDKKKNDYSCKFQDLQDENYHFIPSIFVSSGSINEELRHLINILLKALYARDKHGVVIHNYYIELSLRLKKLIYGALYDHCSPI